MTASPQNAAERRYERMLRRLLVLNDYGFSIENTDLDRNKSEFEFLSDEWMTEWYGPDWCPAYVRDQLAAVDLAMSVEASRARALTRNLMPLPPSRGRGRELPTRIARLGLGIQRPLGAVRMPLPYLSAPGSTIGAPTAASTRSSTAPAARPVRPTRSSTTARSATARAARRSAKTRRT